VTSWHKYKDFQVNPRWIGCWLQADKLTTAEAERELLNCKWGVVGFLRDLRQLQQEHEKLIVRELQKAYAKEVASRDKPFRKVEEVEKWRKQYAVKERRYKMLILDGDSMYGKTSFAVALWGEESTFVVDCTGGKEPDLRDYRPLVHKCVVMDEMSLSAITTQHKKLMQAPHVPVTMGATKSQMYAYHVFLAGTAIIVTTNKYDAEFRYLDEDDKKWLYQNSVYYWVDDYLYERDAGSPEDSDPLPPGRWV